MPRTASSNSEPGEGVVVGIGNHASLVQFIDDAFCSSSGGFLRGTYGDLRGFRWFIGGVDAREIRQLAAAGLAVQALGIALLGLCQWRVDEDLVELAVAQQL